MLSFIIKNFAVFIIEHELKFLLSSFLSRTKISFRLSRWFGRKTLCFILFYSPGLAVFHSFLDFQISSYLMIHQQYLIIRLDISLSSLDYQINSYLMIHQQYLIIWLDISLSSLDYQINSYLIHHLYLIIRSIQFQLCHCSKESKLVIIVEKKNKFISQYVNM